MKRCKRAVFTTRLGDPIKIHDHPAHCGLFRCFTVSLSYPSTLSFLFIPAPGKLALQHISLIQQIDHTKNCVGGYISYISLSSAKFTSRVFTSISDELLDDKIEWWRIGINFRMIESFDCLNKCDLLTGSQQLMSIGFGSTSRQEDLIL